MVNGKEHRERLKEVIQASWFSIENGVYIYTRVKELSHVDLHLMIINDGHEITVVTREENLHLLGPYEANKEKWRLINIRCGNPFYCAGFIAFITNALAEEGIDIVLASSYSNDLVLVMQDDLDATAAILTRIGFKQMV